jgi:uncharacterized repeat protein (TIGR01451 family)
MRPRTGRAPIVGARKTGFAAILTLTCVLGTLGIGVRPTVADNTAVQGLPPGPEHSLPSAGNGLPTEALPNPTPPPPPEQREPWPPDWLVQAMAGETASLQAGDLSLTKSSITPTGDPYNIDNGAVVTYTIVISNSSQSATITDLLVVDVLPRDALEGVRCAGVAYTCIYERYEIPTPSGSTIEISATRQISWSLPSLAPGVSVTLQFSGTVVGQPDGSIFTNRACATYYQDGQQYVAPCSEYGLTAHVPIVSDEGAGLSSVPTWFSDDVGGTISQDWGDFDRDGDLDLVLGSSLGATIYRNEDGRLEKIWPASSDDPGSGRPAYGVRWADVMPEPEHYLELVVVGDSTDHCSTGEGANYIYQYDGASFSQAGDFSSTCQMVRLAPGDYNGDGDVDLVVSSNAINGALCGGCNVYLLHNDGTGVFTGTAECLNRYDGVAYATAALAPGDFDDDGDLDLALGAFPGTLQMIVNWSAGQTLTDVNPFTATQPTVLETFLDYIPYELAWGDYDLDGDLDLAGAYPLQREARIYRNDGAAGLVPIRQVLRTGPFMTPLAVDWGDFNADGQLELVVADSPPVIYRYVGEDRFVRWSGLDLPPVDGQVWSVRGIDLNEESDLDLVMSNRDGPSRLFTALAPTLRPNLTRLRLPLPTWSASGVAWGDWEGDGDLDLIFGSGPPPALLSYLYENDSGTFTTRQPEDVFDPSGFGPHAVAFGDVTGDGPLEVAIGTASGVQVFAEQNTESFAFQVPTDQPVRSLVWGDVNDDGWLDLLVGHKADAQGSGLVSLYLYQDVEPYMTLAFSLTVEGDVTSLAWGDYDGDYYQDFAAGSTLGGAQVYRNFGDATFTLLPGLPPLSGTPDTRAVAWADYDADGDLDLAVGNHDAQDQIWQNQDGAFQVVFSATALYSHTTSLAWGDWNSDGYPELAVGRDGEPDVVYANLGSTPQDPRLFSVWRSDEISHTTGIAWGDRDGDGDLDLAVSHGNSERSGFYENTMRAPVHLPGGPAWAAPLPNNPSYLRVTRPGSTDDAYFCSTPQILGGPGHSNVTVVYTVHDAEADPVTGETMFEYSLDGGSQWYPATPASGWTGSITQTSPGGVLHSFLWDSHADVPYAISDDARFRVRVIHQDDFGPVQHASTAAVSPPFRVRALDCYWPVGVSIAADPEHPDPEQDVRFEAEVDFGSGPLTAHWDLGDTMTHTGWMTTHQYVRHGLYNVTLRVDGPACPVARPGFAQLALTVGAGYLPPRIYLPLVLRSDTTGTSAVAEAEPTWAPAPPAGDSIELSAATAGAAPLAVTQAPGENTVLGMNTIRINRNQVGFQSQPAVNQNGTRVAFWSTGDLVGNGGNADGSIEIFMAEIDAEGDIAYTQITSSTGSILGGFNLHPSINYIGDTIAFFSDRDLVAGQNPEQNFEIFVANVGGDPPLAQVTRTPRGVNSLPTISGDGTRVAFVSDQDLDPDGDNADGNQEIFVADLSITPIRFTQVSSTTGGINDQPSISGDGEYIAYVSTGNDPDAVREIWLAQLDASAEVNRIVQITSNSPADSVNEQPSVNGNGERIVFLSTRLDPDGVRQAFLAEIDTTFATDPVIGPITSDDVDKDQPSLSGGGARLAYVSIPSPTARELGAYEIDAESAIRLGTGSGIIHPALTPDGSAIAFVSNWDIYLSIPPEIDLGIDKSASPSLVGVGEVLEYTLVVSNAHVTPAGGVSVHDTLPAGVETRFPEDVPDYTDDDNTSLGFGGGMHHGTRWDAVGQWLTTGTENSLELPDEGTGIVNPWVDLSDNVLLLHLNEDPESEVFSDSSGNDNHLSCSTEFCPTAGVEGKLGAALQFSGTQYIAIASNSDLEMGNYVTLMAWIYPTGDGMIVNKEGEYEIGRFGETIRWAFANSDPGWTWIDTGYVLPLNRWTHVAVVYSQGDVRTYANGRPVHFYDGSGAIGDVDSNNDEFQVGHRQAGGGFFSGIIDEVAVFKHALTVAEVLRVYDRQSPAYAGYFDSRMMEAGEGTVGWSSIALLPSRPVGIQLPDYGAVEGGYPTGTVDMSGNVLLLHFNESQGLTTFSDTSGQGLDASCSGTNCPTLEVPGPFGTALQFDGIDDYAQIPDDASIDFDTNHDFSVVLWVRAHPMQRDTTFGDNSILEKWSGGSGYPYVVRYLNNTGEDWGRVVVARWDTVNSAGIQSNRRIDDGRFHHVVFIKDGGLLTLYVDGELQGTTLDTTTGDTTNGSSLFVGRRGNGGNRFRGTVDEIAILDRALSPDEVHAQYLRGAVRIRFQARACDDAYCNTEVFEGPDGQGTTYQGTQSIYYAAAGEQTIFLEDWEGPFQNWAPFPLWHMVTQGVGCGSLVPAFPSPSYAFYFGRDGDCDYDMGVPISGALIRTGPIPLAGEAASLSFWSYEQTECGGGNCGYDKRTVDVSTDGGSTWTNVWGSSGPEGQWYEATVDLSAYVGQDILIRFFFDSVDGVLNDYLGWMVDDVRINVVPPGSYYGIFPPAFRLNVTDERYFQYRVFVDTYAPDYLPELTEVTLSPRINCAGTVTLTCDLDPYIPMAPNTSVTWQIPVTITSATYEDLVQGGDPIITNTARVSGIGFELPGESNVDEVETELSIARLSLEKTAFAPAVAGLSLVYTLTVSNDGPDIAHDVTLTDPLPEGVSVSNPGQDIVPSQGSCDYRGGTVTCDLGALAGNSSATVIILAEIDAELRGAITNTASVTTSSYESDLSDNEDDAQSNVVGYVDLSITKSAAPSPARPDQALVYTLVVDNDGPSQATGVTVIDTLPVSVTYESDSAGCDHSSGILSCNLSDIAPSASASLMITVTVDSLARGALANNAIVSADENELTPGDNSTILNTTIYAEADLELQKSDHPDPVSAGQPLTYTLVVDNNGPDWATGVTLVDTLPASVSFDSVSPGTLTCSESGGSVTCNLENIAPDDSETVVIHVTVDAGTTGVITNTARATATETDLNMSNNWDIQAFTNVGPTAPSAPPLGRGSGQPAATAADLPLRRRRILPPGLMAR